VIILGAFYNLSDYEEILKNDHARTKGRPDAKLSLAVRNMNL